MAEEYSCKLKEQIDNRIQEMKEDDNSHYLIYQVLGVANKEGELIDLYQNKGRFLYKYAGAFLEEVTFQCFKYKYPLAKKEKVINTKGQRPKTFEIDCLINNQAFEIKWRDATTDGDHITKEHTRVQCIKEHGFIPIRIMFYYPNRSQALRIQETLKTIYLGVEGFYYAGDDAWNAVQKFTDVDLKCILTNIASDKGSY